MKNVLSATQVETPLQPADSDQIRRTARRRGQTATCDVPWPKDCKPFCCPDLSVNFLQVCVHLTRLFHDVDVTEPEPSEAAMAEPVVASEEVAAVAERKGA